MDNRFFIRTIYDLKDLLECPNTFKNRLQIRKLRRKINKMIKAVAKEQARIAYEQAVSLYQNVLKSNLS